MNTKMNTTDTTAVDPADIERIAEDIEVALLCSDAPLGIEQLAQIIGDDASVDAVRAAVEHLEVSRWSGRKIHLLKSSLGYQLVSTPDATPIVLRCKKIKPTKLSRALLEVLAIIAYHQPVTRGDIEKIRGVAVSINHLATLTEYEWIREVGRRETPGYPRLYATTKKFLSDLNLDSLRDLPDLQELNEQAQQALADTVEEAAEDSTEDNVEGSVAEENTTATPPTSEV